MAPNILVIAFVGLFILFLIESIYFLKKKLTVGTQNISGEEKQDNGKLFLAGGLIVIILLIASFGWIFLSKQKTPTSNTTANKNIPTEIPTQPPTPTLAEIVYTFPTVTETPISSAPILSAKVTPTKTPTPTKRLSPTPTLTPVPQKLSPTPTVSSPIGGPPVISPTTTPTPTLAVVVVPKTPVAGSIGPTLALLFFAFSSVVVGLIL